MVEVTIMTPCLDCRLDGSGACSQMGKPCLRHPFKSQQTTDGKYVKASGFFSSDSYVAVKSLAICSAFPVADPYKINSGESALSVLSRVFGISFFFWAHYYKAK